MRKFLFLLVGMLSIRPAAAQTANRYEEVLPMREDMVVDVKVGNWAEEGVFPFAIDFGREHTVIAAGRDTLLFGLEDTLRSVALGENIFFKTMAVTTENLKSTPPPRLDGVLGLDFFARSVVTIDRKGGMITISAP